MRTKLIFVILIFNLFTTNCSLQKDALAQKSTVIGWEDLQVAPRINEDLCPEISLEKLDTWESTKQDFTYGLAVGFLPEDLSIPRKISHETYWVSANKRISFDWLFWYPEGNKEPANLRLFIVLDERQLDNALPQPGSYNDINLDKGDDKSIKVIIPPLSVGIHDVIAVGIPYPQNEPDEYGSVIVVYRRITLIVDSAPSWSRTKEFISLPAEGSMKRNDPELALELTLKKDSIDIWNWPDPWLDIDMDAPIVFFALAGHKDVTNLDAPPMDDLEVSFFSLLLFMDYQQVEIAPGQMALYNKVSKDTAYSRIPIEILPPPQGKHHILVLRIDTPGVPMCVLQDDPSGRILPNSVYGKLVGINVLPPK